jgi:hypothetical protein
MHPVEADIRKWSHEFLEVPNEKLNGLPPCPYAKQAWLDSQYLPDMHYLDGWCDGVNEALSIAGKDMHLMVFHPDYDAQEAGLDFLVEDGVVDESLVYCMVFVQRLSPLDDAALSLEKSGYYKHFPVDVFQSLVIERRRLRNDGQN